MNKKLKVSIATLVITSMSLTSIIFSDELSPSELVNQALTQKSFYYYNAAYAAVMTKTDSAERDALLNKLSSIANVVWSNDVKVINQKISELAHTSSGQVYDDIQVLINSSKVPEVDKSYFLGEVTSWGKQLVWTPDYTEAVKALVEGWETKDSRKAEQLISKVHNKDNEIYLLNQLKDLTKSILKDSDKNKGQAASGTSANTSSSQDITKFTADQLDAQLKAIVKNGQKYHGESTSNGVSTKYDIHFTDFNESAGNFRGKIEWPGFYVTDDIEGQIKGDKLFFKQVMRNQGSTRTEIYCEVTMTYDGNGKMSGTWYQPSNSARGTTWFSVPAPKDNSTIKYSNGMKYTGNLKDGAPDGEITLDLGNNVIFKGNAKSEGGKINLYGNITYSDGIEYIGMFSNGQPIGLGTYKTPDGQIFLLNFKAGKPIEVYTAQNIDSYRAKEIAAKQASEIKDIYKATVIDAYQASDIPKYQASGIEEFHAQTIDEFHAETVDKFIATSLDEYKAKAIEAYKSDVIDMYQATPVSIASVADGIEEYEAKVVELNPPGSTPDVYPVSESSTSTSSGEMNMAMVNAYGYMNALQYVIGGNLVFRNGY